MRITSLLFWVEDNKRSEQFYKKVGFDVRRFDEEGTVMSLNGFDITFKSMRDEVPFAKDALASEKGNGMYIYIYVEDVDRAYAKFLDLGLKPSTQPKDWGWGSREFILKDPDGYKLCFWQPIV